MGFFAPLISAYGALSTASKVQIAASAIGGAASYMSAKQQRKQAIADQDKQFVRMRNAAERAGFNPLTVLRATGGQGFTGLPTISKAAAFGNAAAGIFDAVRQSPIDKYNKEVRDLEIKQRKAELKIAGLTIGKMSKPKVNNISNIPSGMTVLKEKTKANVTTDEGVDLPNDPMIPQGYTVPKEVMEQFPVHLGGVSLSGSPMSPAAVIEEQYGEAISWLYGPAKVVGDIYYTGMKAAVDAGAVGYNFPPRGKMSKARLEQIRKHNSGAGSVKQNYKIHREDILLGVMPPLSQEHFIKNGKQVF